MRFFVSDCVRAIEASRQRSSLGRGELQAEGALGAEREPLVQGLLVDVTGAVRKRNLRVLIHRQSEERADAERVGDLEVSAALDVQQLKTL